MTEIRTTVAILVVLLLGAPAAMSQLLQAEDAHSSNLRKSAGSLIRSDEGPLPATHLAFQKKLIFAGSAEGLAIFRRQADGSLRQLGFFDCAWGGGDVSVWKRFAIVSVTSTTAGTSSACTAPPTAGLRIVNVKKPARPRQIGRVDLPCGSCSHTLLPRKNKLFVFVIPFAGTGCARAEMAQITVVRIPLRRPGRAKAIGSIPIAPANSCAELVVYPDAKLMATACGSTSLLWQLSRSLLKPKLLSEVDHAEIQSHTSVAFTWDAKLLLVGDVPYAGSRPIDSCTGDPRARWGRSGSSTLQIERNRRFGATRHYRADLRTTPSRS